MRWVILVILGLVGWVPAWAAIHVILSASDWSYEEASDAFKDALGGTTQVAVQSLDNVEPDSVRVLTRPDTLLVPIGMKAAQFVAEHARGQASVLGLMVPSATTEQLPIRKASGSQSYVYVDQPMERSLSLIQLVLPAASRVGVVVSENNRDVLQELGREAARRRLSIQSAVVRDAGEVGPELRRVLSESDVFLLIPDALVLGGSNLRVILEASYRLRVPVIGFSPGLVKAGAVAAVYSTPSQIGGQGGVMARRWLAGGGLPNPQTADQFAVGFNGHVARSMGLVFPSERDVVKAIEARTHGSDR